MRRLTLFALLIPACQSPEYLRLTGYWDGFEAGLAATDTETSTGDAEEGDGSGDANDGSEAAGDESAASQGESEEGGSEASETGGSSGPAVEDSADDPPPTWQSLVTTPEGPITARGPVTIEAVVEHAATVELRLDGELLGVFEPVDGMVELAVPVVSEGHDGEHVVDAVASSPVGVSPRSVKFTVDLPPGGQEVAVPWVDQEEATFSGAFAMVQAGDRVVTLGALDGGNGSRLVLREHGPSGALLGKRVLGDWTVREDLAGAKVHGFDMALAADAAGGVFVAANLVLDGEAEPRGYLAGLSAEGVTIFPEVLLAPGEEIAGIAVHDGKVFAVGRKAVNGGRTVAAAWAFDAASGAPAWAPVQVDVPDPEQPGKPRSARFHAVAVTNDGNLLAVGSTQPEPGTNPPTSALFVRLNPTGLLLGEPEVFSDQYFFLQTAALAVTAFTGPGGYCWTGWTRDGDFDPEMMVTHCVGETIVSRFTTDWPNSAGLAIAYTPLTGRVVVGGHRSLPGELMNGWVIAFADGDSPLASPHGWTWEYDSPVGGVDRVTAVGCGTYDCDVLAVSDLFGDSRVRLGRLNQ